VAGCDLELQGHLRDIGSAEADRPGLRRSSWLPCDSRHRVDPDAQRLPYHERRRQGRRHLPAARGRDRITCTIFKQNRPRSRLADVPLCSGRVRIIVAKGRPRQGRYAVRPISAPAARPPRVAARNALERTDVRFSPRRAVVAYSSDESAGKKSYARQAMTRGPRPGNDWFRSGGGVQPGVRTTSTDCSIKTSPGRVMSDDISSNAEG
jgi:hypothetical protein